MRTKTQNKKTDLRALGFTEITNLIMVKGGNAGDDDIEKNDLKKGGDKRGEEEK